MNKYILSILLLTILSAATSLYAQLVDNMPNNWIKSTTYTSATNNANYGTKISDIVFYDGLGYPNSIANTDGWTSIVTPVYYDEMMRESRSYLPYACADSILHNLGSDALSAQAAYYADKFPNENGYAYSENIYEKSPLSRPLVGFNIGNIFRENSKHLTYTYALNEVGEVWEIKHSLSTNSITVKGNYNFGTLFKTVTLNEDGTRSVVFKNAMEQIILERIDTGQLILDTYYVYDAAGRLVWVISPQGSAELSTGDTWSPSGSTSSNAYLHCYIYTYDDRGRIIEKKLPGKATEYFIYDKSDRIVMTQDGNMRKESEWIYNVYDAIGNLVEQNLIKDTVSTALSHSYLRDVYDSQPNIYPELMGSKDLSIPFDDGRFVVTNHLYSARYGGYDTWKFVTAEPEPITVNYFQLYRKDVFLYAPDGYYEAAVNIDKASQYFHNGEVKSKYGINSANGLHGYYYIPEDCMHIVQKVLDACSGTNDNMSFVYSFPGIGSLVTGSSTTETYDRPAYVPVLQNKVLRMIPRGGLMSLNFPFDVFGLMGEPYDANPLFLGYGLTHYETITIGYDKYTYSFKEEFYCIPEDCLGVAMAAAASSPDIFAVIDFTSYDPSNLFFTFIGNIPYGIWTVDCEWARENFTIPEYLAFKHVNGITTDPDLRENGLKVYENAGVLESGDQVERAFYYDSKGRIIQTVEKNHLGAVSRYSTKYDFVGNVLASCETHGLQSGLKYTPYITGSYLKIARSNFLEPVTLPADAPEGYFTSLGMVDAKYLIYNYTDSSGGPKNTRYYSYYYIPVVYRDIAEAMVSMSGNAPSYEIVSSIPGYTGEFRNGHAEERVPVLQGQYVSRSMSLILDYNLPVATIDPEGKYFQSALSIRPEFSLDITGMSSSFYYIPEDCLDIVSAAVSHPDNNGIYSLVTALPGDYLPSDTYCWRVLGDMNVPEDTKITRFTYDPRGRLLTETTSLNGSDPAVVEYGYDELGKLTSKTYGLGDDFLSIPVVQGKYFRIHMFAVSMGEPIPNPDPEYFLNPHAAKDIYRIKKDLPPNAFSLSVDYYIPVELLDRLTGIANSYSYYEIVNSFTGDGEPLVALSIPVGNPLTETYDYNIQGWLTSQNSELFDMQLRYYDPLQRDGVAPSYTGNITEWRWQHTDPTQPTLTQQANSYGFAYDGLGRLLSNDHLAAGSVSAASAGWASVGNGFREYGLTYDLNGNILSLDRSGFAVDAAVPVPATDVLSYTYRGNQLASLDHSNASRSVAAAGKKQYSYDSNGNMYYDGRKGLYFGYNYLNLLSAVSEAISISSTDSLSVFERVYESIDSGGTGGDPDPEEWEEGCGGDPLPGGSEVSGPQDPIRMQRIRAGNRIATYTWLADGTKLQVADSTGRGYVYLGSLVYAKDGDNLTLESTGFGGGRITASEGPDGMGYATNYQITDHLGSVRVVFESRKNVLARNDYYAFGKKHLNSGLLNATGDINRWHYNGKEWQTTAAVGFLDYGARMYDQEIGRWFGMDFLSEKYYSISPFVYCANSSVNAVDPNGMHYYMLTADGRIVLALQRPEDNYDRLYDPYAAKSESTSMSGEYVEVTDQGLLPQLAGGRDYAAAETSNSNDAFNVFKFIADNSNMEWSVSGYKNSIGSTDYVLNTNFNTGYVRLNAMGRNRVDMTFHVHSHPGGDGNKVASGYDLYFNGLSLGNGSDADFMLTQFNLAQAANKKWPGEYPKLYIYHKESGGIYNYNHSTASEFVGNAANYSILKSLVENYKIRVK